MSDLIDGLAAGATAFGTMIALGMPFYLRRQDEKERRAREEASARKAAQDVVDAFFETYNFIIGVKQGFLFAREQRDEVLRHHFRTWINQASSRAEALHLIAAQPGQERYAVNALVAARQTMEGLAEALRRATNIDLASSRQQYAAEAIVSAGQRMADATNEPLAASSVRGIEWPQFIWFQSIDAPIA